MGLQKRLKKTLHISSKQSTDGKHNKLLPVQASEGMRNEPEDLDQPSQRNSRGPSLPKRPAQGSSSRDAARSANSSKQPDTRAWYYSKSGDSAYLYQASQAYPYGPYERPLKSAYLDDKVYRRKYGGRFSDDAYARSGGCGYGRGGYGYPYGGFGYGYGYGGGGLGGALLGGLLLGALI